MNKRIFLGHETSLQGKEIPAEELRGLGILRTIRNGKTDRNNLQARGIRWNNIRTPITIGTMAILNNGNRGQGRMPGNVEINDIVMHVRLDHPYGRFRTWYEGKDTFIDFRLSKEPSGLYSVFSFNRSLEEGDVTLSAEMSEIIEPKVIESALSIEGLLELDTNKILPKMTGTGYLRSV